LRKTIVSGSIILSLIAIYLLVAVITPVVHVTVERNINQSVENSFRTLMNPFKFQYWIPGFQSVKPLSGEMNTPSSENIIVLEFKGREFLVYQKITDYERFRRFGFLSKYKSLEVMSVFVFNSSTSSATMSAKFDLRTRSFLQRPVLLLSLPRIRKMANKAADDLKAIIESGEGTRMFL